MIECIDRLDALRARIAAWKRDGRRIGLVPTMGNLHAGHHALVRLARAQADVVVASVFVNPTQFGAGEDLARYPRTPKTDVEGLDAAGCDLAWMPAVETMYPLGLAQAVQVRVPGITDVLEGAQRPGHFDGVCTVVARLLNQVQPEVAAFGRKDYQQLVVVRHLVRDMSFAVEVRAGDTVREADGLAMSSRNQYLSPGERATAPGLHQSLLAMREGVHAGHALAAIESQARAQLTRAGFNVDYAALRTPELGEPEAGRAGPLVALVAARLGRTRLIDNLEIPWPPAPIL
ncbi:pantoate--beta-alanine ligase [soil metagenome]